MFWRWYKFYDPRSTEDLEKQQVDNVMRAKVHLFYIQFYLNKQDDRDSGDERKPTIKRHIWWIFKQNMVSLEKNNVVKTKSWPGENQIIQKASG